MMTCSISHPGPAGRRATRRAAALARTFRHLCLATLLAVTSLPGAAPAEGAAQEKAPPPLTVFAAASLADALAGLAEDWRRQTGQDLRLVLGGSSALARQIARGAPADLFLSANSAWMDDAVASGAIDPGTVRPFASNRLVVIAPAAAEPVKLELTGEAIEARLGATGRLAIALPEAVPAGIHAREALIRAGLWDRLAARTAPAADVRAALRLVATGAAPLGIVYASDALAEPRVQVVARLDPALHRPIRYVGGVATGARSPARAAAFLHFLVGPEGARRLAGAGLLPLVR